MSWFYILECDYGIFTVTELLNIEETSLNNKQKILSTTIECGQCMIGDTITRTVRLYNNGGGARFWIISEDDWCSENVMVKIFNSSHTTCKEKNQSMNNIWNFIINIIN